MMVMVEADKGKCLIPGDKISSLELHEDVGVWKVWVSVDGGGQLRLYGRYPKEEQARTVMHSLALDLWGALLVVAKDGATKEEEDENA